MYVYILNFYDIMTEKQYAPELSTACCLEHSTIIIIEYQIHLIDGETDAKILHTHLPLLASVLLHEGNETRALAVTIVILVQVYLELRVVGEGGKVTTSSSLGTKPTAGLDQRVPTLC